MATQEPPQEPAPRNEPAPPTVPTKVCPHCGTQSQTTSDKCPNCGKSYKVKRRKGVGCLSILGGIVLLIIVIAVASAALTSGDKPTVKKGKNSTNTSKSTAGIGDTLSL